MKERKEYNIAHTNENPYTFCKALTFMLGNVKDINTKGICISCFDNNLNEFPSNRNEPHLKNMYGVIVEYITDNPQKRFFLFDGRH